MEITQTVPYVEPARATQRGQVLGLTAVGMVLIFALGVTALGYPEWGGPIAAIDIVSLAGIFVYGWRRSSEKSKGDEAR